MWRTTVRRTVRASRLLRSGSRRPFASVRSGAAAVATVPLPPSWFSPSQSSHSSEGGTPKGVDERALNMGKTIRTLQERMPTLLQSPLPTEILSPHISLHLFPSTHPHLPTVRGRVAYIAALWTAPVAWGRLPGGNMRLEVVSERMLKRGGGPGVGPEQLIFRWRTKSRHNDDDVRAAKDAKAGTTAVAEGEFSGIFIFQFDEKGRIATHTIENSEEDRGEDRTSSVITVTEWLLKKARGDSSPSGLAPAYTANRS